MANEYLLFLYFVLLGLGAGFCYYFFKGVVFVCKNNIVMQIICDLLFCGLVGIAFLWAINKFNSGQIRAFLLAGGAFGFYLYAKTLGKLFAKAGTKVYNHLVKLKSKFVATKFGKVLFKWKYTSKNPTQLKLLAQ